MKNKDIIVDGLGDAIEELASLPDGTPRVRALAVACDKYRKKHPKMEPLLEAIFMRVWAIEGEMDDWR